MKREDHGRPSNGERPPATAAVRGLEDAVSGLRVDSLRLLRIELQPSDVLAFKTGRAPACAAVRALEDALSVRARVNRLRMLRVDRQRGHVRALQADVVPACAAVAGLEDALLPRACVDDVGIATIDDEGVDVALVIAVLAPLRRLVCEKFGARGLPARAAVRRLEDAAPGADIERLRVSRRDRQGIDPDRRQVQESPGATTVRTLEDPAAGAREQRRGVLRVEDEFLDVPAREAGRRPPPDGIARDGGPRSPHRWLAAILRTRRAAAAVEAVEAEQAARGGNERGGCVTPPPPPCPPARLLDQRFERFDVGRNVGARGPWSCENAHRVLKRS